MNSDIAQAARVASPCTEPCVLQAIAVMAFRVAVRVVSFSNRRCKSKNRAGSFPCRAPLSPKQLINCQG